MLEKALSGSKRYRVLILLLLAVIAVGAGAYLKQLNEGLSITGMSRDVSWGFYIAQFTFLVGVAASAVTVVLPYYLHDYKKFSKITILGEFLAIASVIMCLLFIFADMGQPFRILNVFLYPSPNSPMFWDTIALSGYLILNLIIGWATLGAERKKIPPPKWVKPFIYISIPWAVSIHTVTAFIYAGLPDRHLWLSAIIAARFLASAFASGPSLLILFCLIMEKFTSFKPGREPIRALSVIVVYAFSANIFFLLLEFFTSFYSGIPAHSHSLVYLFSGLEGHGSLVPFMLASASLALISLIILLVPSLRNKNIFLISASVGVILSIWIDKGFGFVSGGFVPNPMNEITEYAPTIPELAIGAGIFGIGLLILTILYKITISVREEV
jgi:molybdopterin-containing oxidoreductase family membrane subunit